MRIQIDCNDTLRNPLDDLILFEDDSIDIDLINTQIEQGLDSEVEAGFRRTDNGAKNFNRIFATPEMKKQFLAAFKKGLSAKETCKLLNKDLGTLRRLIGELGIKKEWDERNEIYMKRRWENRQAKKKQRK